MNTNAPTTHAGTCVPSNSTDTAKDTEQCWVYSGLHYGQLHRVVRRAPRNVLVEHIGTGLVSAVAYCDVEFREA